MLHCFRYYFWQIALVIAVLAVSGEVWSMPPEDARHAAVLVLRSGRLLQGEITPLGDRYRVKLGPGNEMRIPATEVEFQAASLVDAYQRKREALAAQGLEGRPELVEWCLRYGLVAQASSELTVALEIAPQNARLVHLQRRLQAAMAEPERESAGSATSAAPAPRWDDLEKESRELPVGAVERFTATIQPLLINRCAANSCHGPTSNSAYHLLRPGLGNTANRRFTLRNLHATLSYVDKLEPDDSRLLKSLQAADGPHEGKVFAANEQSQFELLAAWVRMASRPKAIIAPATISATGPQSPHASRLSQRMTGTEPPPVDAKDANSSGSNSSGSNSSGSNSSGSKPTPQPVDDPRDPFDPEIFNRKYFGTPAKSP